MRTPLTEGYAFLSGRFASGPSTSGRSMMYCSPECRRLFILCSTSLITSAFKAITGSKSITYQQQKNRCQAKEKKKQAMGERAEKGKIN